MLYEFIWLEEAYDPTAPSFLAGLFAFEYAFNKLVMTGDIAAPALPLNVVVTQSPEITKSKLMKQKNGWVFYINPNQKKTTTRFYGYHDLTHLLTTSMILHVGKKQDPKKEFEELPDKLIVKLSKIQEDIMKLVDLNRLEQPLKEALAKLGYKNIKQVPLVYMVNFLEQFRDILHSLKRSYEAGVVHGLRNDVLDIKQERPSNDDQAAGVTKYTRVHYGVSDQNKGNDRLRDSLGGQPQYYVEETIGNYLQMLIQVPVEESEPMVFDPNKFTGYFLKYPEHEGQQLFDKYGGQEIVDYILQLMPKFEQLYNSKLESIKKLKPTQLQP
jgi:hypothetical protein